LHRYWNEEEMLLYLTTYLPFPVFFIPKGRLTHFHLGSFFFWWSSFNTSCDRDFQMLVSFTFYVSESLFFCFVLISQTFSLTIEFWFSYFKHVSRLLLGFHCVDICSLYIPVFIWLLFKCSHFILIKLIMICCDMVSLMFLIY
jgi:hypothetical protein